MSVTKPETDESRLVQAAVANPAEFARLYDLYFARIYAYVSRRVGSRADAEDMTSEVFHRALEHLPKYEFRGAPFVTWLYRIAANCLADRWQKAAREKGNPSATEPSTNPEDLVAAERISRLASRLEDLPADQRRVVQMRFLQEKSVKEIADQMGRSEGAVKQLQYRALEWLRARMSEENG